MEVEGATSFVLLLNDDVIGVTEAVTLEVEDGDATSFELRLNGDVTRVTEAVIFDPIFLKYRGRM